MTDHDQAPEVLPHRRRIRVFEPAPPFGTIMVTDLALQHLLSKILERVQIFNI
jgi:hypothetical protein